MKCPFDNCAEILENKNDLYFHANDCIKNTIYSKSHKVCMFNPKHLIKNEEWIQHSIDCKQSKENLEHISSRPKVEVNNKHISQNRYCYNSLDESLNEMNKYSKTNNKRHDTMNDSLFYSKKNTNTNSYNTDNSMFSKPKNSYNKYYRNNNNDSIFQNYNFPKGKKEDPNNSIFTNRLTEKVRNDNKYYNNNMFSFFDRSTKIDSTNNNYLIENSFIQQDSLIHNNNNKQAKMNNMNSSTLKMSYSKEKKISNATKNKEVENSMQDDSLFLKNEIIEEFSEENKMDDTDEAHKQIQEKKDTLKEDLRQNLNDTAYLFDKAFNSKSKKTNVAKPEKVDSRIDTNDYAKEMMNFFDDMIN